MGWDDQSAPSPMMLAETPDTGIGGIHPATAAKPLPSPTRMLGCAATTSWLVFESDSPEPQVVGASASWSTWGTVSMPRPSSTRPAVVWPGPRVGLNAMATDLVPIVCASGEPGTATHAPCAASGAAPSTASSGRQYFIDASAGALVDRDRAGHACDGAVRGISTVYRAEELERAGGRERRIILKWGILDAGKTRACRQR